MVFSFGCFCLGQIFLDMQHYMHTCSTASEAPPCWGEWQVVYLAGIFTWKGPAKPGLYIPGRAVAACTVPGHCWHVQPRVDQRRAITQPVAPWHMFVLFNAASYLLQYMALVSYTNPSFCFSLVLCPICQDDFELHSYPQRYLQPLSVTSRLNKHTFSSTIAIHKNTGKHETNERLTLAANFQ